MKEAVTKVIDTLTQEDFHEAFQKLLERNNKCIEAGGDYFERDLSFMCVLSIKVPIQKKSGNLSYAPRTLKKDEWKHLDENKSSTCPANHSNCLQYKRQNRIVSFKSTSIIK